MHSQRFFWQLKHQKNLRSDTEVRNVWPLRVLKIASHDFGSESTISKFSTVTEFWLVIQPCRVFDIGVFFFFLGTLVRNNYPVRFLDFWFYSTDVFVYPYAKSLSWYVSFLLIVRLTLRWISSSVVPLPTHGTWGVSWLIWSICR